MTPNWAQPLLAAWASVRPPRIKLPSTLRMGTDCSGLGAPEISLRALQIALGIRIDCVYCSDTSSLARTWLARHVCPRLLYRNLVTRELDSPSGRVRRPPRVQLYVAGFPCSDITVLGLRKGLAGPQAAVMWSVCAHIVQSLPRAFVLENVLHPGSVSKLPCVLKELLRKLRQRLPGYEVTQFFIDAVDYRCASRRPRVYIIGVERKALRKPLDMWQPLLDGLKGRLVPSLTEMLLSADAAPVQEALTMLRTSWKRPRAGWTSLLTPAHRKLIAEAKGIARPAEQRELVVDLCERRRVNFDVGVAPVLATSTILWHAGLQRRLVTEEKLRLLGFPLNMDLSGMPVGEVGKRAGLSISLPAIASIFLVLLANVDFDKPISRRVRRSRPMRIRPARYFQQWRAQKRELSRAAQSRDTQLQRARRARAQPAAVARRKKADQKRHARYRANESTRARNKANRAVAARMGMLHERKREAQVADAQRKRKAQCEDLKVKRKRAHRRVCS